MLVNSPKRNILIFLHINKKVEKGFPFLLLFTLWQANRGFAFVAQINAFFLEKFFFQHCAKTMINGKVIFLHLKGFLFGYDYANLGKRFHFTARAAA